MPLIRDSLWNGEIEIERCAYIQRTRHGLYKFKVLIKLITQMHYNFTNKHYEYCYISKLGIPSYTDDISAD